MGEGVGRENREEKRSRYLSEPSYTLSSIKMSAKQNSHFQNNFNSKIKIISLLNHKKMNLVQQHVVSDQYANE
jgi:hypothetical protein